MLIRRSVGLMAAISLVALADCSNSSGGTATSIKRIPGSGVVAEENRSVGGFSKVDFATVGSLFVEQGATETLRIRAENNLLPYLVTEVLGGVLVMRTANGVDLQETRSVEFFLTTVDLDRFVFSGVGGVEISSLTTDDLSLTSSGVGDVVLSDLAAVRLDVTLSGLGSVEISGQVDEQFIRISGWGDCDFSDLDSRFATVTLTAAGSATVRVSDRLIVRIVGSGSVFYIGDPVVESTVTGSGRVVKIG